MDSTAIHPRVCAKCEKLLPRGARYCSRCGSSHVVELNHSLKQRSCPNCRMMLMSDAASVFCPHCGTVLMDMTFPVSGVPIPPRRRKRRWFFTIFFTFPAVFFVFFGMHWSSSSRGTIQPAHYEIHNYPVRPEIALPPQQWIEYEKNMEKPLIVRPMPPTPPPVMPYDSDYFPLERD